jgi:hypothetical protein
LLMIQISQIAAMSLNQQVPTPSFQPIQAPPIQQLIIPTVQPFRGAATVGSKQGQAVEAETDVVEGPAAGEEVT